MFLDMKSTGCLLKLPMHLRKKLTLLMVNETSELYLQLACFGDDIAYLQYYHDLEKLLDESCFL